MSTGLEIYELLRETHNTIKLTFSKDISNELANAIEAVDSVLYMAEYIAIKEEEKEFIKPKDIKK